MNDLFLRALAREPVDRPPVWFMRQAGRCLPRYREIRESKGFLELVADPESAALVTALPLEYFPVDALVLFQDLSTPFQAAGLEVELRKGVGPVVLEPWSGPEDVDRLEPFDPRDRLAHVLEAIRILRGRHEEPVIGFVGAPYTLCSYLLRGTRERRLARLRALMMGRPGLWDRLAGFWADHLAEFGLAQYEAGVPSVHFGSGYGALLPLVAEAGGDTIGVDWRTPLDEAWSLVGEDRGIQGNLDPAAILAGEEIARRAAREVLRRAAGRPGHIFNLGHGLHPESDPAVISAVIEEVRTVR
ncbi:MAG: uroporphyrinogen decarboxylase family protein [Gemmatimonadota bacterium]|nr:uroporphyrinogen decarboxylase family protein [Gemmatimonadota bacterium]